MSFALYLSCGIKKYDMQKLSSFFLVVGLVMILFSCTKDTSSGGVGNESENESQVEEDGSNSTLAEKVFLGYNGRSTEGPSWTDERFLSLISASGTMCIRYPGGTQANSWDWKEGKLVDKADPKYLFRIKDLVAGLPETAQVVYVMNMVNTPERVGVEQALTNQSIEALHLKIDDALFALKEFDRLGRLPMAVELGNEFYFQNEHAAFYGQNPQLYIEHVKVICEEIHDVYPDMKIAVVTTKGGTKIRDAWNKEVYDALSNDDFLKKHVYAVVQHHYISNTTGNTALRITDGNTAEQALAEAFAYMESVKEDYENVPEGYKLWITEFGVTKYSKLEEEGMWPIGLSYAVMVLSWLEMGNKIDCYMLHHITNNPAVINTFSMCMGPAAIVYKEIIALMTGCKSVSHSESYADGKVRQWVFSHEGSKKVLLINTSASVIKGFDISGEIKADSYRVTQYFAPNIIQSPVSEDNGIEKKSLVSESVIDIEPFGFCVIEECLVNQKSNL